MKNSAKGLLLLSAALMLSGCNKQVDDISALDMHKLMVEQVEPQAKIYWDSVQYISDEQGSREISPKTDADWEKARQAAVRVGEFGALLTQPAYQKGRGADWGQFAQALTAVSQQAAQAAESKSKEKVLEAGGMMYNVCSACHEVYLPLDEMGEPIVPTR